MTGTGLVLIAIAVGGLLLAPKLEAPARHHLEEQLSNLFGSQVEIEALKVNLLHKELDLVGLTVFSPKAFKDAPAVQCSHVRVRPKLSSLFSYEPKLRRIVLEDTVVNLRYEVGQGSNLGALSQHATDMANAQAAKGDDEKDRVFMVEDLITQDTRLKLSSNVLPVLSIPLTVSPFQFKVISGGKSASMARVSAAFMRSVITEVITLKGVLRPIQKILRKELESE
jgi:hypothetical protein